MQSGPHFGGGAIVGGFTWLFTGGDQEAAQGVWDTSLKGTYIITPEHLKGEKPVQFVGSTDQEHQGQNTWTPPPATVKMKRAGDPPLEVDTADLGRSWGRVKARQYAGRDGLPHAGEQTPPHPGGVFQIPAQLRPQRAILQAGAHHEEARPKEGGT